MEHLYHAYPCGSGKLQKTAGNNVSTEWYAMLSSEHDTAAALMNLIWYQEEDHVAGESEEG